MGKNNFRSIKVNNVIFYWSFAELIAAKDNEQLVIIDNIWCTKATATHLNYICRDKSFRLDEDTFRQEIENLLERNNLTNVPELKYDI
jgi:hypothetical protein